MPDEASPPAESAREPAPAAPQPLEAPAPAESAQMPAFEPILEVPIEPISDTVPAVETAAQPASSPATNPLPQPAANASAAPRNPREMLVRANSVKSNKKQERLAKILAAFAEHEKLSNSDVRKLLHVSDATATRYLSQLAREGKIRKSGKSKGAVYSAL